jgi:P4 family phage/plasmid primase-like protien
MLNYEVCQVPNYQINYKNSKKINKPISIIKNILDTDLSLHERLHKNDNLKLAVDVDKLLKHNPNTNLDKILYDICSYLKITLDDISHTNNKSVIEGSHHIVIPKYYMNSKNQKNLWKQFKKIYNYGAEIDAGIFDKEGWFRLPNQRKESVDGTEHIIIKGENTDFVLKYIDEATEYIVEIVNIPDEVKTKSKKNIPVQVNNKAEFNQMWFNEINFLINNQCFNSHCSTGNHNEWVSIAGMFMFLFNKEWFVLWENLTLQFGSDNKKLEYSYQSSFIKPVGEDSEKVMNTLRMWAKNENIEGYKLWVREECRIKKLNSKEKVTLEITEINDEKDEDDCVFPDNNEMPEKISKIDELIEEAVKSPTEYNFALIAHQLFKNDYKMVDLKNKIWYKFENHRWVKDKSDTLRNKISTDLFDLFDKKIEEYSDLIDNQDDEDVKLRLTKTMKSYIEISQKFKKTNDKNNIMRECAEIFCDDKFNKLLNSNKYLLCFNNGVLDLKNNEFRDGKPDDYISLSTEINYVPYEKENTELIKLLKQIMPYEEQYDYMMNHLGSTLFGENINQTFQIYAGSGSNGKSVITALMKASLGSYYQTAPLSLICGERTKSGQSSSELIALKGARYAVMNEPHKGCVINEGMLKERTGGDDINARELYGQSENFTPQISLVCCLNTLFNIHSNDDGTWRRIEVIDFVSKFIDIKDIEMRETDEGLVPANELEFVKDKNLKDKIPSYAEDFLALIIKYAIANKGVVVPSKMVINSTLKYRYSQNKIQQFIDENIIVDKEATLSKSFLLSTAKEHFGKEYYKPSELIDNLKEKYDFNGKTFWGIKLKFDETKKPLISREEEFKRAFNQKFVITNDLKNDFLPTIKITEWAKLTELKIQSAKEINQNLLVLGLNSKDKNRYKNKKINGESVNSWFGLRYRNETDPIIEYDDDDCDCDTDDEY